jgi:hypothetical protein
MVTRIKIALPNHFPDHTDFAVLAVPRQITAVSGWAGLPQHKPFRATSSSGHQHPDAILSHAC